MCRDWSEATATHERDAAALGLDAPARLRVVGRLDESLLAGAHLQGERALTGFGQHFARLEAQPDLRLEPEPVEPARRQHHGIETTLATLAQPGVDVAAERLDRERRLERQQLRAAANRRCPDPHSRPDRVCAAQRVPGILAGRVGTDRESFGVGGGHVLGRVHRDVDPTPSKASSSSLTKTPRAPISPNGPRPITVTRCGDRHERNLDALPPP